MPVRGLGGAAIVTVKSRDDLRLSRNGCYILQSSYESTFSFALTNSGNRFVKMTGAPHTCEGIQFTDNFVGEDPEFRPPDDHPISKEDVRLFDQTLRMCTIYVSGFWLSLRAPLSFSN
ncbi:hypothetical protein TELCIR_18361 [Teladorsagia circumcincta]|uniref:Uncharacterized protein n=1 Tax=Teladorsagia circumcincta TaxID=45464 RepID=A0A2G9TQ66_TELCI|nr:hypothetical protein TELCIR_18361 [Teladorsagia circumcincta]